MRYWGLDVLVCVHCKHHPLEITVIESETQEINTENIEVPVCKDYCGYLKEKIDRNKVYPCQECLRIGIKTAVLYCTSCGRWYPVKNGIVYMLTDNRRNLSSDKEFLKLHMDKIPEHILKHGKPVNLETNREEANK
ncbi:Trm112 family protein [Desulfurococcus amylolyticus]|uniref:Trm112 family protein n=1 Tax=Desulfurococcus TaxID=2273 RepID=UPI0005B20293|nr:Trm112 family protein [Desulfurococcus amylolyticus]